MEVVDTFARDDEITGVIPTISKREAVRTLTAGPVSVVGVGYEALLRLERLFEVYSMHDAMLIAAHRVRETAGTLTNDREVETYDGDAVVWSRRRFTACPLSGRRTRAVLSGAHRRTTRSEKVSDGPGSLSNSLGDSVDCGVRETRLRSVDVPMLGCERLTAHRCSRGSTSLSCQSSNSSSACRSSNARIV